MVALLASPVLIKTEKVRYIREHHCKNGHARTHSPPHTITHGQHAVQCSTITHGHKVWHYIAHRHHHTALSGPAPWDDTNAAMDLNTCDFTFLDAVTRVVMRKCSRWACRRAKSDRCPAILSAICDDEPVTTYVDSRSLLFVSIV